MSSALKHISKFLSYILRHHPEEIDLMVDAQGWAHLPSLIEKARKHGRSISKEQIKKVIQKSSKNRFSLSDDEQYIRAGYGHSIDVDLGLTPQLPPTILYHGTAKQNIFSIQSSGLQPQSRNLVHLSDNKKDAISVGGRHGKPMVLTIEARRMYKDGYPFYQSDSEPGIWLVKKVPPQFISI